MAGDIESRKGDFSYESCSGALREPFLIITMATNSPVESEEHEGLSLALNAMGAAMVGNLAWIVKTRRSPESIIEELRRHLTEEEYACAFTICDSVNWFGPHFLTRIFEAIGVQTGEVSKREKPVRWEGDLSDNK
jgi:arginine exporter protein ArgO